VGNPVYSSKIYKIEIKPISDKMITAETMIQGVPINMGIK